SGERRGERGPGPFVAEPVQLIAAESLEQRAGGLVRRLRLPDVELVHGMPVGLDDELASALRGLAHAGPADEGPQGESTDSASSVLAVQRTVPDRRALRPFLPGRTDGPEVLLALLGGHAASVVLDLDTVHTTEIVAFQADDDASAVRVERVPQQLFDRTDRIPQACQFGDMLTAGLQPHPDHDREPPGLHECVRGQSALLIPGCVPQLMGITRRGREVVTVVARTGAADPAAVPPPGVRPCPGRVRGARLTYVTPGVFSPVRLARPRPAVADCPSCSVEC